VLPINEGFWVRAFRVKPWEEVEMSEPGARAIEDVSLAA
jgi:hypothetical protein